MVEDARDCFDVLHRIASIKAAASAPSGEMLEAFALYCLHHPEEFISPEQAVERAFVRSGR